jgi:hypothetical protein
MNCWGFEGNATRIYFGDFAGMIKADEGNGASNFRSTSRVGTAARRGMQ